MQNLTILLLFFYAQVAMPAPYEIFISPTGNDSSTGTFGDPLKTLYNARDKAVASKAVDGAIITLLGGTYKLDSTLNLTMKHVGTNRSPLTIRGKDGDTVILTGAINLKKELAKPCDKDDIAAGIDPIYAPKILKWSFDVLGINDTGFWSTENIKNGKIPQIYSEDALLQIAQWPDTGYVLIDSIVLSKPFVTNTGKINGDSICNIYLSNKEMKNWVRETSHIFLHGYWCRDYFDNYEIVENVDTTDNIIRTKSPPNSSCGYCKGQRYRVLNLLYKINKECKWAVDPVRKYIYLWPSSKNKSIVPMLTYNSESLFNIRNFSNLTIQNITMESVRADAIQLNTCTTTTIDRCIIKGVTGNGITHLNSENSKIMNCKIFNIGRTAIEIQLWSNQNFNPSAIWIINNIIHDYANIAKTYKPAILLGRRTLGCRIAYNTIYNAPHSAITFWGNNHNIENNYIFNVCTETQDAGVMYTGCDWASRGTVIKNNYIKDCGNNNYVNGVYIDDYASGISVNNNVFEKMPFGIRIGDGSDNTVQNNTFVNLNVWLTITQRHLSDFYSALTARLSPVLTDSMIKIYPVLSAILEDRPECAKRNVIQSNTIVNSGKCNFISEADTFGVIDSGTFVPWYSGPQFRFGVQPVLDSSALKTVALRRMPLLPLVRNVFSIQGVLFIACVPSYYAGNVKAKITNLRTRAVFSGGSEGDTVVFQKLAAGDYVYNIWYTNIPYQDSTFSAQDTIHFSPEGSLSNETIYSPQPDNPCILGGTSVDSARIALYWKVNALKDVVFDSIGLWYNEFGYPGKAFDSGSVKVGIWDLKTAFDTITGLKPDKLYYFSVFGQDTAGNWSKTSDSARVQIRTGKKIGITKGNPVLLQGSEAETLFTDTLRIWGDELAVPYIDTVDEWDIPFNQGFIISGPAFIFRNGKLPLNMRINFSLRATTPVKPYSIHDIRVYRFNVNTLAWRLDTVKVTYEIANNRLKFSTSELGLPFVLMIDTLEPNLSALIDTAAYTIAVPMYDTFTIRDNIENPRITLLAGPGARSYTDLSYFITAGRTGQYTTTIPAYVADPVSGLRSLLVVSDSRFADTMKLSRKIVRTGQNCDDVTIPPMEWTPVAVTAQLSYNTLESVFAEAMSVDTFNYDSCQHRIMRWLPVEANRSSTSKWMEYTSASTGDFAFSPGKTIWIKSKKKIQISFGTAVIPALIDTFQFVLKNGVWNDFSLPYHFDIYAADIIAATGLKDSLAAGVELNEWVKTGTSYSSRPLYLSGIGEVTDSSAVLKAGGAYIAFNNSDHDITLRIPPVSTVVSNKGQRLQAVKKNATSEPWSIKLGFRDGNGAELPPVCCLALPENSLPLYYQAPPTFTSLSAGVLDKKYGKRYGHAASGELSNGGTTFIISCENKSEITARCNAFIENCTNLPTGTKTALYFDETHFDTSATSSCSFDIPEKKQRTGYLIVGTVDYIAGYIKNLRSVFSFQLFTTNRALRIRYTLPVDVRKMTTSIFDLKGRCLEKIELQAGLHAGEGLLSLGRRFVSGYYVVQMKIEITGKNKPSVLNRQWMFVR